MNISVNVVDIIQKIETKGVSIFLIWLFHISAIIGISVGYFDFFVPKTPLNLLIALGLLVVNYKLNTRKKLLALTLFFGLGMFAEWVGVHYDFIFGAYSYGDNLGWKLDGVPWLIGVNWAVLVCITGAMTNHFKINKWFKILLGAFLMVVFDIAMEVSAPIFDFWTFEGGVAPFQNYIAWYIIAVLLHIIFQYMKIKGDALFSGHLYACQFVFFAYFALFHIL